jgi:hypothetical protein
LYTTPYQQNYTKVNKSKSTNFKILRRTIFLAAFHTLRNDAILREYLTFLYMCHAPSVRSCSSEYDEQDEALLDAAYTVRR